MAYTFVQNKPMRLTNSPPIGTWFIAGIGVVPDEDGILVVLPDGRCVQFPSSVTRPQINQTFRLWYSCPDAATIRFRVKPDGEEWLRTIQTTADGWVMISDDERGRGEFPCKIATLDDLPDWFPEMMDKNLQLMATVEGSK
jgi:hypothetical protein